MFVTLTRIIKFGVQAFVRNGLLSVSTIGIMILAAMVFEGLIIFNVVSRSAITTIQDKIDISVYFKSNAPEDSILNIKRSLEGLDEVKDAQYVSREQALADFKARHAGEEVVSQTLDELEQNPLLASLNIKAKDPRQYDTIAQYLSADNLADLIEKVTYAQNQVVIDRLIALIETFQKAGITMTVFLAFLAVMVTFTTIRLAIFSASDQLSIMRLVGASNSFIRGPYIIEGIFYGFIAGIVSFLIFIPVMRFASPYVVSFIPEVNLAAYFGTHFLSLFFYQLLFCIGLGVLSGTIAIRRYLHL
jgi:cell division transport system permease protein